METITEIIPDLTEAPEWVRGSFDNGQFFTDALERIDHLGAIESLLAQIIEMNGADYFWGRMARMPITKFNGPLRKRMEAKSTAMENRK